MSQRTCNFLEFIDEYGDSYATLGNTLGMGPINISQSNGTSVSGSPQQGSGSGDTFNAVGEPEKSKRYKARRGKDIEDEDEWEEEVFQELDNRENKKVKHDTSNLRKTQGSKFN